MSAIMFPGQGSQYIGMSKDFYENFIEAKQIFEEISEYVGIDLKQLIFEDKNNLLNFTNYTQIAIFTASLAIFKTIEKNNKFKINQSKIMLGHSLGEYSALACSNKLNLRECSRILKKRGDLMHNAVTPNTSGMAALIGCDAGTIQSIINNNNLDLDIANDNSPQQVVISGNINDLNNCEDIFLSNKVKKFVKLNVSAAFHSKYMKKAEQNLSVEIDNLKFIDNDIKIISNYSAEISSKSSTIKDSIKNQMSNKVRWTESILNLEKTGEKNIIEIGPSKVLSGLIRRISNSFDIITISKISDL